MKVYTAQEWQIKFKEQAGEDKQLLHDLNCTGLVKANEVIELIKQLDKFKEIAKHVQEQCCIDCEDSSMCEFGCAIIELKECLVPDSTKEAK